MKKTQKVVGMLVVFLLALGASAITASAKAIGADYTIFGYNAGWVLVIIGVAIGILFASKMLQMPKSIGLKPIVVIVALTLVGGLMMVFVETPAPTAEISGLSDLEFDIEGSAITTAGSYYPDTSFDDSSGQFLVPYGCNTTSDLLFEADDNSSYSDDPRLSFTIKTDLPADADDTDLAIIYFEVTNPTLYTESDADNFVLTKTDDIHQATWTDQDGATNNISGWTSGGIEETLTLTLDLNLYETGLAQADEYDANVLNIKFHNKANTWSETFTVVFMNQHAFA